LDQDSIRGIIFTKYSTMCVVKNKRIIFEINNKRDYVYKK